MKRTVTSILAIGLNVATCTLAQAKEKEVMLHGTLWCFVTQYVESIDPFDVTINGVTLNTGPVTLSLDTTNPAENQTIAFNFGKVNTLNIHTDVLITAPLLKALGEPPIPLALNEFGTFDITDETQLGDTVLINSDEWTVDSRGVIQGGPLTGGVFATQKKRRDCPDCCAKWISVFPPGSGSGLALTLKVDPSGSILSGEPVGTDNLCTAPSPGVTGTLVFDQQVIDLTGDLNATISATPGAQSSRTIGTRVVAVQPSHFTKPGMKTPKQRLQASNCW